MSALPKAKVLPAYRSTMEWLPVAKIEVEPSAQRVFDAKWAKKLALALDPDKLGKPAVVGLHSHANGGRGERFIVVDGQHRVAAVKIALGADQLIECEVIRGVSIARAAEIYRGRNTMRLPRSIDFFLAGVTADNEECCAINAIVNQLQLSVGRTTSNSMLSAVGALQAIYRDERALGAGAPNLLRRTIELAVAAWGRKSESFIGELLRGLALVLSRYGGALDHEALERKLRGYRGGALGLLGHAKMIKQGLGGTISVCVARAVVQAYNSGRHKNLLPEWGAHMGDEKKTTARKARAA